MKKLIFLIVLFFGIIPIVKHGKLTLNGVTSVYADDYGGEDIDSNDPCDPNSSAYDLEICNGQPDNGDPCDPSSSAYDPAVCNATDQCDENSPYYDPAVCEQQSCNPQSTNYDVDECDAQVCDDNSVGTNASECEIETCDPDNINYDVDECDAQVCDDNSVRTNASECEIETCDPDNVNYDVDECDAQVCDDNSVGTNAPECEIETCDPDNINYDIDECDAQICDPTSVGYRPAECKIERCDPDNINYNPIKCAQPDCDAVGTVTATQIPATSTEINTLTTDNDWGLTTYHLKDYAINIGACSDETTWTAVLLSITTDYSQQARLLPGVSEINTSLTDYCEKITDLVTLNPSGTGKWYMLSAIQAHEAAHVTYDLSFAIAAESSVAAAISTLTVPNTGQSKADAIMQIKGLAAYSTIVAAQISAIKLATVNAPRPDASPSLSGVTYQAERDIVFPVAKQICNAADAANLPVCPACNLIP
jgi:hypothetical protein